MKKLIPFILLVSVAIYWHWFREKRYPPGILVPNDPYQVAVDNPQSWTVQSNGKEFRLTPRAQFSLDARVLSLDTEYKSAPIGPADLAVGWGPMSDQQVLDQFKIWHDNMRTCYIQPRGNDWPISMEQVGTHWRNLHIIPADQRIEKQVFSLRSGDLIKLSGYLVNVTADNGFTWLTAFDSASGFGDHACKIVWVQSLAVR